MDKYLLGKNLKFIRTKVDLSQEAFAEKFYTKRTKIASYELGDAKPPIDLIVSICDEYGFNIRDFVKIEFNDANIKWEQNYKQGYEVSSVDYSGKYIDLLEKYNQLLEAHNELIKLHGSTGNMDHPIRRTGTAGD